MIRQAISPRLAIRTDENRALMALASPRTGARFADEGREALAALRAAQGGGEALRRRFDIGVGRSCAAGAEEPLGLGVGARRAALDRLEQRCEPRVALLVAVAIEVREAERRGFASVEPRAGQREAARHALAKPGDEMGRDLRRRKAEARLGERKAGALQSR